MKLKSKLLLLACVTLVSACGKSAAKNDTNAIGTDLGKDGVASEETYLYWQDGETIFRGQCHWGKPILKVNCASQVKSMSHAKFQDLLDDGVSARVVVTRQVVASLIAEMVKVQKEIDATLIAIDKQLDKVNADRGELNAARARIEIVQAYVAEYVEQLKAIDAELAQLSDPELLEQRGEILAELKSFRAELDALKASLPTLLADVADGEKLLDSLKLTFVRLSEEMDKLTDELQAAEATLTLALAEFAAFEDTLAKIGSAVIYTVKSDDDKYAKNRPYVLRFDAIFAANASDGSGNPAAQN